MQLPSGRGKVNAWGENHLWLRYCKGSELSGLVEPRISAALASESVKKRLILQTLVNFSRFWLSSTLRDTISRLALKIVVMARQEARGKRRY
jgi:hypothetical protein